MVRIIIFLILDLTISSVFLFGRKKKYITQDDMDNTAHEEVII